MTERDRLSSPVLQAISAHRATFRQLEAVAEDRLADGKYEDAAAYAQMAADYAWRNHPGLFASPRLERVLRAVALATVPPTPHRPRTHPPRHVLHVLTEAYALGGHTRLTWRWIQLDDSRRHSLVLTGLPAREIPTQLEDAVRSRGGTLLALEGDGLIARARSLAKLLSGFDAVVLNVHPFDVVPTIALASRREGPPIVMVNHADHVFWLGVGVAEVVACIRESAITLATQRRSLDPRRCVLLPVPLDSAQRVHTRREAKAALGLAADTMVLVTVGQEYKYRPADGRGFLDLIVPAIEEYPRAVLMAVGPLAAGEWAAAEERTRGRVRAVGARSDPRPFYEAADVYVDSYPMASITSALEAASLDTPVISLRPTRGENALFGADDPALTDHLIAAPTPAALVSALSLLADRRFCEDLGRKTGAAVRSIHTATGWRRAVEGTFEKADSLGPVTGPATLADAAPPGQIDELAFLVQSHPGWAADLSEIVRTHIGLLPRRARPVVSVVLTRGLARVPGLAQERVRAIERRLLLGARSEPHATGPTEPETPCASKARSEEGA